MLQRFVDILMNLKKYPEPSGSPPYPIVAHRGAWGGAIIENTVEAFEKAESLGAWSIEFDVHFTKDAVPVIHHDPTLKRITGLDLTIRHHTWQELKERTNQLTSLETVLKLRPLHFMIEIKPKLSMAEIKSLTLALKGLTPTVHYHLLALHPDLIFLNSAAPPQAWVLVGEYNLREYTQICIDKNLGGVAGHYLLLHQGLVKALHHAGKKVGVGFVPNQNLLARELSRGVDWIFTNTLADLTGH